MRYRDIVFWGSILAIGAIVAVVAPCLIEDKIDATQKNNRAN